MSPSPGAPGFVDSLSEKTEPLGVEIPSNTYTTPVNLTPGKPIFSVRHARRRVGTTHCRVQRRGASARDHHQTTAPHVVGGGTADTQCRSSQFQCIVRTHTHASKHARTAASLLVPRSPPRCSHGAPHTCAPPPSLLSTWTCTPPSAPRSSPEAHPRPKRDRRSSDRCACAWAARRASPWPARAAAAPSCRRSTP